MVISVGNRVPIKEKNMFFDGDIGPLRFDKLKYPAILQIAKEQMSKFWRPEEIDMSQDTRDFKELTPQERFIFTAVLSRQTILDSIQTIAPTAVLGKYVSLPEVEFLLTTWSFFESIHALSYSWTIQNVYPNPEVVFDEIHTNEIMKECVDLSSKYYDVLHCNATKKDLLFALFAVHFLEGIQFYASFACSFGFAENGKMVKNSKLIKFIAQDEQIHYNMSRLLIQYLIRDEDEYADIFENHKEELVQMCLDVVNMEKRFSEYVFQKGSLLGLNAPLLNNYIDYIATKVCYKLKLKYPNPVKSNPLPYMDKYILSSTSQESPQESEITDYLVGAIKNDISEKNVKKVIDY